MCQLFKDFRVLEMHLQKPHRSLLTSLLMPKGRISGMEAGWSEPSASWVFSGVVVKLPLLILFWLAQGLKDGSRRCETAWAAREA